MALPAVEIDDRDLGDYARGEEDFWENYSDIGSRAKTGPNPEVEVDVELFKQMCMKTGADRCTRLWWT